MSIRPNLMVGGSLDYSTSERKHIERVHQFHVSATPDSQSAEDPLDLSVVPQRAKNRCGVAIERYGIKHLGIIAFLLVLHVGLFWIVLDSRISSRSIQGTAPLTLLSVRARHRAPLEAFLIAPSVLKIPPIILEMPVGPKLMDEAHFDHVSAGGGRITPPVAVLPLPDPAAFARQMGIASGEGGTVVLRVEINEDGSVGRVEVEVSGGNSVLDRAAITYARAVNWVAGRKDDRPETVWIRWGVRLEY